LHSASAQVGVAIANMLPNLTITGNRGYTATQMANLVSSPNIFWTVAGNATQTLFDGFTLLNQTRAAQAAYDEAAWSYRNTVVTALQNVADSLAALEADATALKAARNFERAAKISLDLAQQQMQTGNANVLLLLTAQQTYLQAVIQVVQAPIVCPTPPRCSRPWGAVGGTESVRRRRSRYSTSRPVVPNP